MTDLKSLAAFVADHDMPMVRVEDDHVLATCEYVQHGEVFYCELVELRTFGEARDWLGY